MAKSGSSNAIDTSSAGVVSTVDHVRHVRRIRECLEAVSTACRHVEGHLLVVAKFKALPVPVCSRGRPQVEHDIEDRAERASDQLRSTVLASDMWSVHDAACRAGQAVLNEGSRIDSGGTDQSASKVGQKKPRSSRCGAGRNSMAPTMRGTDADDHEIP